MGAHREGEFPLHVRGAPQLEDLHRAPAPLTLEHIAQDHHVVAHELIHPVAGDGAVLINALGGHHCGDPDLFKPSDQAEDLAPHHRHSVVLLKHRCDRIDRNTPRLVFTNGVVDALDQP